MLPWSTFWDSNYFAGLWPQVGRLVTNNFVRGAVSGLGIVNLCAGFADLGGIIIRREPSSPLTLGDRSRGSA